MKTDLRKIPYVGKRTEEDLLLLGFDSLASLKGADPEAMYQKECESKGGRWTGASFMFIAWQSIMRKMRRMIRKS